MKYPSKKGQKTGKSNIDDRITTFPITNAIVIPCLAD